VGSAILTKALGLEREPPGMGVRSKRYAMIVDDLKVTWFVEDEPGMTLRKINFPR